MAYLILLRLSKLQRRLRTRLDVEALYRWTRWASAIESVGHFHTALSEQRMY